MPGTGFLLFQFSSTPLLFPFLTYLILYYIALFVLAKSNALGIVFCKVLEN